MAHYEYSSEPYEAIRCARCSRWHERRRYVSHLPDAEQPIAIEGMGVVWLCHECAVLALRDVLNGMTDRKRAKALKAAGITVCGELHVG